MKRCVVIGSGLGGLSCGCILSKNGYEVTVLEQGTQIGGCLQCFRRGDAVFDTGMHYIGSAAEGQVLNTMLKYFGIDSKVKLSQLDPEGYDVVSFKGKHYRFANGKEAFVDTLAQQFPDSRKELETYFDLVSKVAASSAMHSLDRNVDMNVQVEYQTLSVNEVIDSIITNPTLREVLAGIQPLYAGLKNITPFSTHALISDFYNQSAYRIVGGSASVADSLASAIKEYGGSVLTRKKVTKIECNDMNATAVVTSDGQRFDTDLVVSTIHPTANIQLVDSHFIRPAYRMRMKMVHNTTSAFVVYLKFRKDTVKYMNSNLYYYRGSTTWGCEEYDDESWPKFLLYMHICHEASPEYAHTGEILTYMTYDEVKKWIGTTIGNRGDDYVAFKRMKAERIIKALEEEVPGISECIETYYTSTPLTYVDYTGTLEGSMYGVAKDINTLAGTISCKTRIPNLLLAGQSIVLHGMQGVLAGSFMTCAEVLTMNEIFAQLNEYK